MLEAIIGLIVAVFGALFWGTRERKRRREEQRRAERGEQILEVYAKVRKEDSEIDAKIREAEAGDDTERDRRLLDGNNF